VISSAKQPNETPDVVTAPSARRADATRNRESLLAAAREEYVSSDGLLRMHAVARRAGVGVGTLYRHFPRREDLAEALALHQLEQLVQIAEQANSNVHREEALREYLSRSLEIRCDPTFTRILLSASGSSVDTERLLGRFAEAVRQFVVGLQALGRIQPHLTADHVVLMLHGAQVAVREAGEVDGITDVYAQVLAAGMAPTRA
jgi:AcrR family transcriptional regulator